MAASGRGRRAKPKRKLSAKSSRTGGVKRKSAKPKRKPAKPKSRQRAKPSTKTWRKGQMHRALGIDIGRKIPDKALWRAARTRTGIVRKRAIKLLNVRGHKTKGLVG